MNVSIFKKIAVAITILSAVVLTGCGGGGDPESDFSIAPLEGGKQAKITAYRGDKQVIRIPSRLQGLPVTAIGQFAFFDRRIISVTIPNSITVIENGAFANNLLTNVTIPNSVTVIGTSTSWEHGSRGAFQSNQLTNVAIPNSVTEIGRNAFRDNQLTNVTIPNSVTKIGLSAFSDNRQLTSATIPESFRASHERGPGYASDIFGGGTPQVTYTKIR